MPVSKNRGNHRQKVVSRNIRLKEKSNRLKNFYKRMEEQLASAPQSVPELLNKEELLEPTTISASSDVDPSEAIEIIDGEEYLVVDAPELIEPVTVASQWAIDNPGLDVELPTTEVESEVL